MYKSHQRTNQSRFILFMTFFNYFRLELNFYHNIDEKSFFNLSNLTLNQIFFFVFHETNDEHKIHSSSTLKSFSLK